MDNDYEDTFNTITYSKSLKIRDSIDVYSQQKEKQKTIKAAKLLAKQTPKLESLENQNFQIKKQVNFPEDFIHSSAIERLRNLANHPVDPNIHEIGQDAVNSLSKYLKESQKKVVNTSMSFSNNESFTKSLQNISGNRSVNKSRSKSKNKSEHKAKENYEEVKVALKFNNENIDSFNLLTKDEIKLSPCINKLQLSNEIEYFVINNRASVSNRASCITMGNFINHDHFVNNKYAIEHFGVGYSPEEINPRVYLSPSIKIKADHFEKEYTSTKEELNLVKSELKNAEMQRFYLHKYIESLKGHIRIYLRIKPSSQSTQSILNHWKIHEEDDGKNKISLDTVNLVGIASSSSNIRVVTPTKNNTNAFDMNNSSCFHFNKVFDEKESQITIFNEVKPLLISALDGENVCIFAYGATGSGKTYTMQGKFNKNEDFIDKESGILPRIAFLLFEEIKRRKHVGDNIKMSISAIEIYNDNIFDLLDTSYDQKSIKRNESQSNINITKPLSKLNEVKVKAIKPQIEKKAFSTNKNLSSSYLSNTNNQQNKIKKQIQNNQIKDQKWESLNNKEDIIKIILKASETRVTESTKFNSESSRSHAIYQIKIQYSKDKQLGESFINIVDLAGSEKSIISSTTDKLEADKMKKLQTEAGFINKSLTTLGRIINILSKKDSTYPPYRESKLTQLLQNSLNDSSKTALIVTVSNNIDNYGQTRDSLNFAKAAMTSL